MVNALVHRVRTAAAEVDVQPPRRVVHVRAGVDAVPREVLSGRSEAPHHDAVVAESPFNDVVVVRSADRSPQHELLTTTHLGVLLPRHTAIPHYLAHLSREHRPASGAGT